MSRVSRIPISNIYLLLAYAWDQLSEAGLVDVDDVKGSEVVDLLATVLVRGVKHVARRGLNQVYHMRVEETRSIRGRIHVAESARKLLLRRGLALCEFDDLSADSLANQIIRATLKRLRACETINPLLQKETTALLRSLKSISDVTLTRRSFTAVQFQRNTGFYRFLLNICQLIFDQTVPSEEPGKFRFRDFLRDHQEMPKLFERFLYNFLRIERSEAHVSRDRIRWNAHSDQDPDLDYLPTMNTDISFRVPGKTIVLDAKFYESTLQRGRFDTERVHSGHLFQLFAYLKNLEGRGGQDATAEGVLVYPTVGQKLRLSYDIAGHRLKIQTIDLAGSWQKIKADVLDLVGIPSASDTITRTAPYRDSA